MSVLDFTFVTYSDMPDLDPDDRLALDILRRRGLRTQAAVWNDEHVDWPRAGICIVRSTWDYNKQRDAFVAWANRVAAATPLWNPPSLIQWNTHKSYLQDLANAGVEIVPTYWIQRGSHVEMRRVLLELGWLRAVIKPAVGLSTHGVKFVSTKNGDGTAGQSHVETLLRDHDVMVQPFIESVEDYGERALVFIDGEYSHAVRKPAFQPLLPAGEAGETPTEAALDEVALAVRALAALPEPALYARVDVVRNHDGQPLIIELELVEPTLFLGMDPQAPQRFADALLALVD